MKKASFVVLAFAFTIVVPAFAQNYIGGKAQDSSIASTVVHANAGEDGLRICASQPK